MLLTFKGNPRCTIQANLSNDGYLPETVLEPLDREVLNGTSKTRVTANRPCYRGVVSRHHEFKLFLAPRHRHHTRSKPIQLLSWYTWLDVRVQIKRQH